MNKATQTLLEKLAVELPQLEVRYEQYTSNPLLLGYAVSLDTPNIEEELYSGIIRFLVQTLDSKEYPVLFLYDKDPEVFPAVKVTYKEDRAEILCRLCLVQKYKETTLELPWGGAYVTQPLEAISK